MWLRFLFFLFFCPFFFLFSLPFDVSLSQAVAYFCCKNYLISQLNGFLQNWNLLCLGELKGKQIEDRMQNQLLLFLPRFFLISKIISWIQILCSCHVFKLCAAWFVLRHMYQLNSNSYLYWKLELGFSICSFFVSFQKLHCLYMIACLVVLVLICILYYP